MNIALVVAGGKGVRMGADIPKQFIEVSGKPIIVHTLEKLQASPLIDKICVTVIPEWQDEVEGYVTKYGLYKIQYILPGGETRLLSTYNGLSALAEKESGDSLIMLHDANRPMITEDIIEDSIRTCLEQHTATLAAAPCFDSMYMLKEDGGLGIIDRNLLFKGHSPESYFLAPMLALYERAKNEGIDLPICQLCIRYGVPLVRTKSTELNIKLTTREDIEIFKTLMRLGN